MEVTDRDIGWLQAWGSLRTRRIWFLGVAIGLLPSLLILGLPFGLLIPAALLGLLGRAMWDWKCPRCRNAFGGWIGDPWPDRCQSCGIQSFSPPSELAIPFAAQVIPGAKVMVPWMRRTLASFEAASGAFILLLFSWMLVRGASIPGWAAVFMQSFAALTIVGGVLLWQDKPAGYELSMVVQVVQVVRFQIANFGLVVAAGPELLIGVTSQGLAFRIGANAGITLGAMATSLPFFAINFVPLVVLVLLRRGRAAVENQLREAAGPGALVSDLRGSPPTGAAP